MKKRKVVKGEKHQYVCKKCRKYTVTALKESHLMPHLAELTVRYFK